MEKLCVFCDHLVLSGDAEHGYYEGDVYPYGTIHCGKKHAKQWTLSGEPFAVVHFTRQDLAEAIRTAEHCEHYSPPTR